MKGTNNFNNLVQKAILKKEKRKHSFHQTHYVRHPVNKVTLSKYWVENNNSNLLFVLSLYPGLLYKSTSRVE